MNCSFLMKTVGFRAGAFLAIAAAALPTFAQLSPEIETKMTAAAQKVVSDSGVPSASVGIVENGQIVYTHAFGLARLQPPLPATAAMAYPVGSISKQFTATAVLLLQQDGKLSLNDPVAKYFPELTRAQDITLRNLLTHTSGYQDYAPQDYTIPAWRVPGDALKTVHEFAGKPLDFEPGTQWQYSNTNFVLSALIVEKVSGMPFAQFLRQRVIGPVGLKGVLNLNTERTQVPVTGYMRNALAPLRPAVLEGPGWYFGDADLAMPVASLLTWDLALINKSLLSDASYREMETPFTLKDGRSSHYGLGVFITEAMGHAAIEHSGEVGGFVAENIVFPYDHAAIAVLTNQEASSAAADISRALMPLVLAGQAAAAANPANATAEAFAPKLKGIMAGLVQGKIDRSLFTPDCNAYFDADGLSDFQTSLSSLGVVASVSLEHADLRGGMTFGAYQVVFSGGTKLRMTVYLEPDGKVEQLLVEGKE